MIRRFFIAALVSTVLLGCAPKSISYDATYYLVRHAEKTTEKPDPALTTEGQKRAQALAERLSDVSLTAIYSSDYHRTRDTAMPVATSQDLDVVIYDPRSLENFAKVLLAQKGQILVIGHSNTTPRLSVLLGGEAGPPIVEATEYDRLYVLRRRGANVRSQIERYGD